MSASAAVLAAPVPVTGTVARASGSNRKVLPGFNLTLGYTVLYLSLIVLILMVRPQGLFAVKVRR